MSLRLLLWAKLGILKDLSFIYPNKSDDFQGSVIMPKSLEPLQAVYPDSEWWVAKDTSDYEHYAQTEVTRRDDSESQSSKIEIGGPLLLTFRLFPDFGGHISGKYHTATQVFEGLVYNDGDLGAFDIDSGMTVADLVFLARATQLEFLIFLKDHSAMNRAQRQLVFDHLKYYGYKGEF